MFGEKKEQTVHEKVEDFKNKTGNETINSYGRRIQPELEKEVIEKTKSLLNACLVNMKLEDKTLSNDAVEALIYSYVRWVTNQMGRELANSVIPKKKEV